MYVIALDFDGVLCNSAYETACTGWRACQLQWPENFNTELENEMIDAFRDVRPVLKTGYESMILLYLLQRGISIAEILKNYTKLKSDFFEKRGISAEKLKDTFGATRDNWIKSDFNGWLKLNKFYAGVIDSVKNCPYPVYIVTTKQKRFTTALCEYIGLDLSETHIFGLEDGEKSLSLKQIHEKNQGSSILFIEDRLDNLLDAQVDKAKMYKFYADWGYGTKEDNKSAKENPHLTVITLSNFSQFMKNPEKFL